MRITLGEKFRHFVIGQRCIPWRVSNAAENLLEGRLRHCIPGIYRLAKLGRWQDLVRPLTQGPRHHFYGYFGISPWNRSGSLLLVHQADFSDRPPGYSDAALVGFVASTGNAAFEPIAETSAWNWQQGSMLQWDPAEPEGTVLYNDRRNGSFVTISRNLRRGELRAYEKPFYAVTPDGRTVLTLNFARLQKFRPGYGYVGSRDPWVAEQAPSNDGLYQMDLNSGKHELVISLSRLAAFQPEPSMAGAIHYVNHIQVSRSGTRFAFLHCWVLGRNRWGERLCVSDFAGASLELPLPGAMVSHYDWIDDEKVVAWARMPDRTGHYIVWDSKRKCVEIFGGRLLIEDGHCSFSPNGQWFITDTYPDQYGMRTLILFQPEKGKRTDLARLESPAHLCGEIRCDLHPRWNRDGSQVCIDSFHEGSRQMYVVGLQELTF